MDFTEEQLSVISHKEGNVVVIAGAGSGKTRCLVERTATLISNGVRESDILLFTFTKKAAKEIKQRIAERLEITEDNLNVHVSTIHSLALNIFRDHHSDLNFETATLWPPDRRGRLIREYYKEILETKLGYHGDPISTNKGLAFIDNLVHQAGGRLDIKEGTTIMAIHSPIPTNISGTSPDEYYQKLLSESNDDVLASVCAMYLKSKNVCGVIEFDDMQPAAIKILNEFDTDWKTNFKHIMVDEYQDVNETNVEFVQSLMHDDTTSVMAVGDDDQAIYGFRGSNTDHILNFPDVFDGSVLYLTRNFRSSVRIINLANLVIKNNVHRYDKKMIPNKTDLGQIDSINPFYTYDHHMFNRTRMDQYRSIFEYIQGYIYFVGLQPNEIAILARNNMNLKMASYFFAKINDIARLNKKRKEDGYVPQVRDEFLSPIPFQLNNILSILKRKHITRIINVLSALINPNDSISVREMLMNVVSGFGSRSAEYFIKESKNNPESSATDWISGLTKYPRHGKNTKLGRRILDFVNKFKTIQDKLENGSVLEIWVSVCLDIFNIQGEREKLQKTLHKVNEKVPELKDIELVTRWIATHAVVSYELNDKTAKEGITTLLDQIYTEVEDFEDNGNEVQMMTIHGSKGKEWPVVFLLDLDEETLPGTRYTDLEEERRLFYVGVTRAKSSLVFCRAYQNEKNEKLSPSQFWIESGVQEFV